MLLMFSNDYSVLIPVFFIGGIIIFIILSISKNRQDRRKHNECAAEKMKNIVGYETHSIIDKYGAIMSKEDMDTCERRLLTATNEFAHAAILKSYMPTNKPTKGFFSERTLKYATIIIDKCKTDEQDLSQLTNSLLEWINSWYFVSDEVIGDFIELAISEQYKQEKSTMFKGVFNYELFALNMITAFATGKISSNPELSSIVLASSIPKFIENLSRYAEKSNYMSPTGEIT